MKPPTTRRSMLRLLAGAPLWAATADFASAGEPARIGRLIGEARAHPGLSERIDFISRSLLGVRYQSNTLIGGPKLQEVFVVRDDAFDCVTFCEVVLAAALSRDVPEFETVLRRIRYEHGQVQWADRNHYFAEWSRRAVENRICEPVAMQPSVAIDKTVNYSNQGRRRVSMTGILGAALLANKKLLSAGDVIGFVSRRAYLDFYHTGFIVFGRNGELLLRHASQRRRKVLDERMETFLAVNGVKYVTLLRPVDHSRGG